MLNTSTKICIKVLYEQIKLHKFTYKHFTDINKQDFKIKLKNNNIINTLF